MSALGGATDGAYLEGHSYTYEGSLWGRLVQILMDSKCMNPIIYFGELDKLSGTPRGEEIAGILTHLTDTTQNMEFHDKYFADVDFDFSRAMFIFDYNDETLVNPILRDRLYKIYAKEYEMSEKQIIASKYLIPRICVDMKFGGGDLIIPAATVSHIINSFCSGEKGVRNLKRALETIYRKLNLIRLIRGGGATVTYDPALFGRFLNVGAVNFPFVVTPDIVNKLIDRPGSNVSHLMMYA
jgi:ATP-dependent Lon protease